MNLLILYLKEFKSKFEKEVQFKVVKNIKEIHTDVIMGSCKSSKNIQDRRGYRIDGQEQENIDEIDQMILQLPGQEQD